jgi:hypothetical protein
MRKKYKQLFILLIIFSFSVSGCLKPVEEYKPPEMVKEIFPNKDEISAIQDRYEPDSFSTESQKPVIKLEANEILINTINLNLDLDSSDEQIIVMKDRDKPEGKISIAVADYNNVKNTYVRVWQSITGASNIRSFVFYLDDLIGDHNMEIVCSGRDGEGNSTLDIFWRSNSGGNNLLSYFPVFNISEKGTIEIIQQERSRAYQQGLKDGVSYTITVTREEGSASGAIDLIQSNYYWDFPLRRYVKLTEEKLESTEIIEKQLTEILEGNEENFNSFISGPWIRENESKGEDDLIIFFDPVKETATFYSDNIQENYTWVNSYKVLSNLLYIRCRNEIINYIENEIYIRVNGIDDISVTVKDIDSQKRIKKQNEIWSKSYSRLDNSRKEDTIKTIESVTGKRELPLLAGQYISDSGDSLEFYGSEFFMKTSFTESTGGFAVYSADVEIIDLKVVDETGVVTDTLTFEIDFKEEKKDRTIERTLVLTPGKLSIYGFRASDTEFYRFVQIETLEMPSSTETEDQ